VTKGHFSDFLFGQMSFGNSPGKRLAAHQLAAKALRKVALVSEA